jgi:hypothetical protein
MLFKSSVRKSWIIYFVLGGIINILCCCLFIYFSVDFYDDVGQIPYDSSIDWKASLIVIPIYLNYIASVLYIGLYIKTSKKIFLWISLLNYIPMLGMFICVVFWLIILLTKDARNILVNKVIGSFKYDNVPLFLSVIGAVSLWSFILLLLIQTFWIDREYIALPMVLIFMGPALSFFVYNLIHKSNILLVRKLFLSKYWYLFLLDIILCGNFFQNKYIKKVS